MKPGCVPRCAVRFVVFFLAFLLVRPDLQAADTGGYVELLRSSDPFARQAAQAALSGSDEALEDLARRLEDPDRVVRFRLLEIFDALCDEFFSEIEKEYQALWYDLRELAVHRGRQAGFEAAQRLSDLVEKEKERDPDVEEKLDTLIRLLELEVLARSSRPGTPDSLAEDLRETLEVLGAKRDRWRKEDPTFDERMKPLLELAVNHDVSIGGAELTELERIRLQELEERVAQRQPRLNGLVERLERVGIPALNRLVARRDGSPQYLVDFFDSTIAKGIASRLSQVVPQDLGDEAFELARYSRGLLWAWILERKDDARAEDATADGAVPDAELERIERLVDRHLQATIADLHDGLVIVRDRADRELYALGARGTNALAAAVEASGLSGGHERFLLELLRWRVRSETYRNTGIDFHAFPELPFRERRKRLFDYARVAKTAAIPTLRAIVERDDLESSFFVKLAAAKALAGLRDLSGYNFLRTRHPDMTMKKPEVSRDLLIIQGYEHIREKQYQRAIEELQKVLDEYPFDFRANYHIAFAYLLLKNYAKSIHHFEIARRIDPEDQLTLYNLACAYALAGKKPEALEALEDAVENGFDDWEHIERDSDLESLREESRYKDLVARLKEP